jgi:hypothetical protein
MKRKSAKCQDRIMYREYVVSVYMPEILDKQKRKVAKAHLRAALAAVFDRLETAAAERLPPACGMEIDGFEDGTHVVARGGRKIVPHAHSGE